MNLPPDIPIHHRSFGLLFAAMMAALVFAPVAASAQVPENPAARAVAPLLLPDEATTSVLLRQLTAHEEIRTHFAALTYATPTDKALRDHFDQMQIIAGLALTTPVLRLILAPFAPSPGDLVTTAPVMLDAGRLAPAVIEDAAQAILIESALALLDRATSASEIHLWSQTRATGTGAELYHAAGLSLAVTLDTLPTVAGRQRVVDTAPASLRGPLVLLAKLHELYRSAPPEPPAPPPSPDSPSDLDIPLPPPKREAHWLGLTRRIGAFQVVLPRGVLTEESLSRREPQFRVDLWFLYRQSINLSQDESQALNKMLRPDIDGSHNLEFMQWELGVNSLRYLAALSHLAGEYPDIILTAALWDVLTEYPPLTNQIVLAPDQEMGLKMLWASDASHQFPLRLITERPLVIFDDSEFLPAIDDSMLMGTYFDFLSSKLYDHRGKETNFQNDPIREIEFLKRRLELAPWLAPKIEPQLIAAGLTPDNPAWADKRDMLAQPAIQALVRQHADSSESVNEWLVDQLLMDYEASVKYHATIKEWDVKFGELRDAAFANKGPENLWWQIFNIQTALENHVADTMAEMVK